MRTSSPWSFELQAGGINHQGVTPLAFTNLVIPAARYSASVPVMVTPLAGGLFHALMAPGTVLATVEMGATFYLVDVTGEIGAQMHGQQSATAAVTAFECVVNATGEGSCDLTIGPGGFDIVGFTELYTLQHSVHVVTAIPAPEPSMLGLVALTGLGVVRRRRPR